VIAERLQLQQPTLGIAELFDQLLFSFIENEILGQQGVSERAMLKKLMREAACNEGSD
jgi:hypothetical protein